MITKETIKKNYDYLDKVALETMKEYISKKPPQGFNDSMSIARVSYKQALAMLEVRESSLLTLAVESGICKKDKQDV